jgi:hypothetical protein
MSFLDIRPALVLRSLKKSFMAQLAAELWGGGCRHCYKRVAFSAAAI